MKSPLEFNDDVQPACLPPSEDWSPDTDPNNQCFVSGWGKLSYYGMHPNAVRWAQVQLTTNDVCSQSQLLNVGTETIKITDSMVCASISKEGDGKKYVILMRKIIFFS